MPDHAASRAGAGGPERLDSKPAPLADPYRPLLQNMREAALAQGGELSGELRRQAAENQGLPPVLAQLVDKIAHHAYRVQDEDILAIKQAGYSEDQIFELVVAAAVGRACNMAEQALSALHAALKPPTP